MTMCDKHIYNEEKNCLKETIKMVLKSIDKGEKKLKKIFKDSENETTSR